MSLGPDTSYSGASKIYTKQQPDGTTFNGAAVTTERVFDSGSLVQHYGQESFGGTVMPAKIAFTIVQGGSSNICSVTAQIEDGAGNAITGQPVDLDICLSDAATGVGLTGTTASGGVAVGVGTQLDAMVAAKAIRCQCDTNGEITINITDTAKTGFYVAAIGLPVAFVSRQLVAGDYK